MKIPNRRWMVSMTPGRMPGLHFSPLYSHSVPVRPSALKTITSHGPSYRFSYIGCRRAARGNTAVCVSYSSCRQAPTPLVHPLWLLC
jgi:hypothetical protein